MWHAVADSAFVLSSNEIDLEFPYSPHPGTLAVTHIVRGGSVEEFRVDLKVDGQFDLSDCDETLGCGIYVQFDDQPVEVYRFIEADGHPPGVLVSDDKGLVDKIRTASKATIDATFFQVGHLRLEFDVKGLKL